MIRIVCLCIALLTLCACSGTSSVAGSTGADAASAGIEAPGESLSPSHEDTMPATREQSAALVDAINARFDHFDVSAKANRNGPAVVAVFRDAVEKDLGYSFDETLRNTMVLKDEARSVPLESAIAAIKADPAQFLQAGLISQHTAQVAAAMYRFNTLSDGSYMTDPEMIAFVEHVQQCRREQPDHPWCTPADLRRIIDATDKDFGGKVDNQDAYTRDFAYKSNLARRSGPLGDAGWIVDVEGKPVQLWGRGPDEPFTLNDAAMDNDHQLWEILQKERQQLGVQNL